MEKPDAVTLPNPRGEVEFKDVRFCYQGKVKDPAIDGISFKVSPGTKTAIVGESGSGKSTCLKLLFRFYDVDEGSITVDGHDLRDLKLDSLRRSIGVVPQDTVLFNATIMYNLLYANPRASQADVYDACKAANIHERIMNFPDQYETKVGERGLKLSGGERQRVCILLSCHGLCDRTLVEIEAMAADASTRNRLPSHVPFSKTRAFCC